MPRHREMREVALVGIPRDVGHVVEVGRVCLGEVDRQARGSGEHIDQRLFLELEADEVAEVLPFDVAGDLEEVILGRKRAAENE